MGQQKKKRGFNDLLIPIILVLAVLPFVVRLVSYRTGLTEYSWYSDFDVVHDFFTYFKSRCFLLIAASTFILLISYLLLHRSNHKSMKPFLLLSVYTFFLLASTLFSVDKGSSLIGGFSHFENIFVLLGYLIMLIYTYVIDKTEKDYLSIIRAFLISLIFLCIIGILQVAGKDLFYSTWYQKLIIPQSDWKAFVGTIKSHLSNNAVSLTMFNPDFASVYLAMAIPFFLPLLLPNAEGTLLLPNAEVGRQQNTIILTKPERIIIASITAIMTILLFKTYARTGLLSLFIVLMILILYQRKLLKSRWKQCLILVICGVILFAGIDFMNDFRFTRKLGGTIQSFYDDQDGAALEEIITKEQGVSIIVRGDEITVSLGQEEDNKAALVFKNAQGEDISGYYDNETMQLNQPGYENVIFQSQYDSDREYIFCEINGITWRFFRDQKDGYLYVNDYGKNVQLTKIEALGLRGWEDIGSGRGYIWSRSIPLLKDTLFIGSGPDTFLYQFPQSDYVGKANNCKTPYTLIEKPHSLYLMTAIQTGVISLIAFIAFYVLYMIKSLRIYRSISLSGLRERVGFGCFLATLSFMISGFFNDSSLQTTPLFFILLGLGMSINYELEKCEEKTSSH